MLVHAHRLVKAAVAVVLIAAFASWQPVMMATMSAAHSQAGHATHGSGGPAAPGHHAPPLQCCDLCPVACAAPPGLRGTTPRVAALEQPHRAHPVVDREPRPARARPHELPFPLGPPPLRVA